MGRKNYSDGSQNTAWDYVLGLGPSSGSALATGPSLPLNCQDVYTIASAQIIFPSAPATISVNLEGSLDGVNWTVLQTSTAVVTNTISSVGTQFRLLRLNVTAFSGGASPTIVGMVTAQPGSTLGGTADLQTILAATGSVVAGVSLNAQTAVANGTTVDFGHAVQDMVFAITTTATTAGAVTMQVSADNSNWVTLATTSLTSPSGTTVANPLTLTASVTQMFATANIALRYARVNISTLVTGGTVSANISAA